MFGYLKKKLGDVVGKFSKTVEEESVVVDAPDELEDNKEDNKEDNQETKTVKSEDKKSKSKSKSEDGTSKKSNFESNFESEKLNDVKLESEISKDVEDNLNESVEIEDKADKLKDNKFKDVELEDTDLEKDELKEDKFEEDKSDEDILEKDELEESKPSKKGFFSKISDTFTKFKLSDEKFEDLFWDLEVALLENNVALEVIQKIKDDLKEELTQDKISRKKANDIILESLHKSINEVLSVEGFDLLNEINKKKPYVITVIGVNGSGKTTTIAKLCNYLKKHNKSVVLAAADTFRAAAIQQIEHHANNLDIKLIKHEYNSDPSAVAFDAIRHAESKDLDVVVIDTAGRLHSNDNLMNELKKLIRVNKPDLKLFVGESITGNDCVEQAKKYDDLIGIDGIILSKADIDDKGGAALSISYVTEKPVLFIGTGQNYDDLQEYDKDKILSNLGI